jgi:hypothetical protein
MLEATIDGRAPFTFAPWRIVCFGRWLAGVTNRMREYSMPLVTEPLVRG